MGHVIFISFSPKNQHGEGALPDYDFLFLCKKNLNAFKPFEHPPSGEKVSIKGLGGNIGCRDEISWYQTGSPM